jgi:hypothetical protein
MDEAGSLAWFMIQATVLLSGAVAGLVFSWLSPRKSWSALTVVLLPALLSLIFAQLRYPRSALALIVWALASPIGLCLGFAIHRRYDVAT